MSPGSIKDHVSFCGSVRSLYCIVGLVVCDTLAGVRILNLGLYGRVALYAHQSGVGLIVLNMWRIDTDVGRQWSYG